MKNKLMPLRPTSKPSSKASLSSLDLLKRQHLAAFLVRCLFSFFYKVVVEGAENVSNAKLPLLIAANHPSQVDPVLLSFLPDSALQKIMPVRFMMAEKYYKMPWYWIVSAPFGAYSLPKWSVSVDDYLQVSREILNASGVIMMFPEGQFEHRSQTKTGRPGIVHLARATGAQVLPLRISFKKVHWYKRTKIHLHFGSPFIFTADEPKTEATRLVQYIMSMK